MRDLAFHCHERLYTLGIEGVGRRRGMEKERRNDYIEGFSYLRCFQ